MLMYEQLAALAEYPGPDFPAALRAAALLPLAPEAAAALQSAAAAVHALPPGRLEEIYAQCFDFRADTSLYIGHHLFGEDLRRSLFMARLRQSYEAAGLDTGVELPDHLAALLRYLARRPPDEETEDLVQACLVPAITAIWRALEGKEGPYRDILRALLLCLREHSCCQPLPSSSSRT